MKLLSVTLVPVRTPNCDLRTYNSTLVPKHGSAPHVDGVAVKPVEKQRFLSFRKCHIGNFRLALSPPRHVEDNRQT